MRGGVPLAAGLVVGASLALAGCVTTSPTTTGAVQAGAAPTSPEEARLVGLAKDIESRGEPGTAVALYARAVDASNGSAAAYVRLGDAQVKAGDPESAKASYQAALAKEPRNPHALLGLGTAELNEGAVDAAAASLREAAPKIGTATAYNRLGTALVLGGKPSEARDAYTKARALAPGDIDIVANLALALALAGENEPAIATMRAAAQAPNARGRHQRNLIVVLSLTGRSEEAAAVAVPDMNARQKADLLARAKKLQSVQDPAARARAVGLMSGV